MPNPDSHTTILALVFILIATPCFAKCKVGADVLPGDDSVWVVSCHSTDNGDWMLDSTGKVHSDDTKSIKKAMKAARERDVRVPTGGQFLIQSESGEAGDGR